VIKIAFTFKCRSLLRR